MASRAGRAMIVAALALAGCKGKKADVATSGGEIAAKWEPGRPTSVKGVAAANVQAALQTRLGGKPFAGLDKDSWAHEQRLYKMYGNTPLWLTKDGLDHDRTHALLRALLNANNDALDLDRYPLDELIPAVNVAERGQHPTAQQFADADALLTAAFVALGEDLLTGQIDPKSVSQSWHIDPQEEHIDSALVHAIRTEQLDTALALMRPQDSTYTQLQQQLVRYRKLMASGGWPRVPDGKAVKPGDKDSPARLTALRQRLAVDGLLPANTPGAQGAGNIYDRTLAGAVATFQARHNIAVDSMLGPETLESLNVPVQYRLGQVAANLERFRWLPRTLGSRYILVNVPAFHLTAFDEGKPALEMKVIVGQEYDDKATPVFSDSMEYVVFRPYWNVTPDIQAKELDPKIAADPNYMAAHNYEYWNDNGRQAIRQKPGGENSLGLVKFLFPNNFNIYLHDTPDDQLFNKDVRAFSHGCIRVEKPAELASWVLGWPIDQVQQQMQAGPDNHSVTLKRKVPVYIAYFTAYMKDGALQWGNDLYHRDDQLVRAVSGGALPSARAVREIDLLSRLTAG